MVQHAEELGAGVLLMMQFKCLYCGEEMEDLGLPWYDHIARHRTCRTIWNDTGRAYLREDAGSD